MPVERGNILICAEVHECLINGLQQCGFNIDYFPDYDRNDLEGSIHNYAGLITRSKLKIDKALLNKAAKLKFIGRLGSGMESIDVEYAAQIGIACLNSPEGNRDSLGEHTLGMLLSLVNNMNRADAEVRKGIWEREANRGMEIQGKTIGIIGYGNMGSAFAERLSGFSVKVIAYDKYKVDYSDQFVIETNMSTIFKETDILSLHVPLTEETQYLVNQQYLQQFSKPIILINTSRGPVVNTADLVQNMKSGKVRGAALDVLEYEKFSFEDLDPDQLPVPMQFLINSDKVILTPHVAGWTNESQVKLAEVLLEKIKNEFEL